MQRRKQYARSNQTTPNALWISVTDSHGIFWTNHQTEALINFIFFGNRLDILSIPAIVSISIYTHHVNQNSPAPRGQGRKPWISATTKNRASRNCAVTTWQCSMSCDVRESRVVSRKPDCRRRNVGSFWKNCINWNSIWQRSRLRQNKNLFFPHKWN